MTNSATYSLWFEPSGKVSYEFKERIKKLSKKYQTPVFDPHVTLLGSITCTPTEAVSFTKTLVSAMKPITLTLTKAGYRNQFYQSLFVHIKKTEQLEQFRKRAIALFNISNEEEYMPHLSLLYGELSQKEKERILNMIGREFYIEFSVKSLVLMQTDGMPHQWKRIHTSVFRG